jgi:hypothetical protein
MQESRSPIGHPELKQIVADASRALALLDAGRLEELALSCQALNRAIPAASAEEKRTLNRQAVEAQAEMAVFGRVLEATRANWKVMNRLRELRMGRLEYTERQISGCAGMESVHGDH